MVKIGVRTGQNAGFTCRSLDASWSISPAVSKVLANLRSYATIYRQLGTQPCAENQRACCFTSASIADASMAASASGSSQRDVCIKDSAVAKGCAGMLDHTCLNTMQ